MEAPPARRVRLVSPRDRTARALGTPALWRGTPRPRGCALGILSLVSQKKAFDFTKKFRAKKLDREKKIGAKV